MRLGIVARRGSYGLLLVALVCLLCLGLVACSDGASSADNGTLPFPTVSSAKPLPTATRPVIGPVVVTATSGASATASAPTLTCAVHSAEGSDDDETQHTLTCTVKHARSPTLALRSTTACATRREVSTRLTRPAVARSTTARDRAARSMSLSSRSRRFPPQSQAHHCPATLPSAPPRRPPHEAKTRRLR